MINPLVSIITPSFNRADFIEETIRSVAAQSYRNNEYFVIDGGSTDGTVDMLEAQERTGSLRYVSEADGGMYDAINKGLARSRGDVLCYINTDDRYLPWSVETAVRYLDDHSDVDIVYGDTLVHDLDIGRFTLNILPFFSSAWLRSGGIIPQPTVFFRRRVYEAIGDFRREVRYLADCEYWLRADRARMRFAKLHEVMAVETNHSGTIRETLAAALTEEKRKLLEIYCPVVLRPAWTRSLLLRAKYVEKEILMLLFFLRNHQGSGKEWSLFRGAYKINVNIAQYLLDKLLRTNSNNWELEERHG